MFRELMRIWSEQAFSSRIVEEFLFMLDSSEEMLSYAFKTLTEKGKAKKVKKNIYYKDQSINLKEQEIRKQILIHLSANPGCNISACLVLISVSKDAERLGDYVKNIFELNKLITDSKKDRELFTRLFHENGEELLKLFETVSTAFKNSDKNSASKAVKEGHKISKRCEEIIEEVVKSDYTTRQAVVLALGARYMKRLALHLSNIASSVVNPLPELDYIAKD
jgi:phosphate transport system protein